MSLTLTEKQEILLQCAYDTVVYGGARGGGKTFGASGAKVPLETAEWYSEAEAKKRKIDPSKYRSTADDPTYKEVFYYRYRIDYPEFRAVIVRKTEPQLLANTKVECDKIYKPLGARWIDAKKKYVFKSGAEVFLRPAGKKEQLDFFQGPSFHTLVIEELTQFDREDVEEIESCVRSTNPLLPTRKVYTCNPGKKGHKWVKEKYIDKCKPVADGAPVYLEEFDITYQPLMPGEPFITKSGESYYFIPSLVFDNPNITDNDKNYVRNLMNKNHILQRMWLYGDWDVFAGQFFDMWDEEIHVVEEMIFFNARDEIDLITKRRNFDWSDWRLYLSNDYGYAEKSAWACGAYAVNNNTNEVIKFSEIVESGLTIYKQAEKTIEHFAKYYDLSMDDFELHIADPKSYFQRQDKGDKFWSYEDAYAEYGIYLTKGINDREPGAQAVISALMPDDKSGKPRLRVLSNCEETRSSIPNLPADKHNFNDVDTTVFDHPYDEMRYFLMVIIGTIEGDDDKKKAAEEQGWRAMVKKNSKNNSGNKWLAA